MNNKILKTLSALAVLSSITFSSAIFSEEISLPVISKPAALQEGTQRELSPAQIAELLPWAKNSKIFLLDLLENVQTLPSRDKNERLVEGIKGIVSESAPKNSELLMRYALNRGLVVSSILAKEMDADAVGSSDVQTRILISSVKLAIHSYENDIESLAKKAPTSFVAFGLQYYGFLAELNKSVIDASAQYAIQKTALEWLQWDLYRDLNSTSYAPQIIKINNGLKVFPNSRMSDAQYINYVRQMKKLSSQLELINIKVPYKEKFLFSGSNALKSKLDVGDEVLYTYNLKSGVISGARNGLYSIKFEDGSYATDIDIKNLHQKRACSVNLCTGDTIVSTYSLKLGVVESMNSGEVVMKEANGSITHIGMKYVGIMKGCVGDFCTGERVTYTYSNKAGTIIAVLAAGEYVVRIDNGTLAHTTIKYLVKNSL